jgi:hypothetical protein
MNEARPNSTLVYPPRRADGCSKNGPTLPRFGVWPFTFPLVLKHGHVLPPLAGPGVAAAVLGFDFGEDVLVDAVAAAKEGTPGFDFIESRAQGRSISESAVAKPEG